MPKVYLVLILILASYTVFSQNLLDKKISLQVKDKPLIEVIFTISELSGINFTLNSALIPVEEKTTIQATNMRLKDVLSILFLEYNIEYKEFNGYLVIYKKRGVESVYKNPFSPEVVKTYNPLIEEDIKVTEKHVIEKVLNDVKGKDKIEDLVILDSNNSESIKVKPNVGADTIIVEQVVMDVEEIDILVKDRAVVLDSVPLVKPLKQKYISIGAGTKSMNAMFLDDTISVGGVLHAQNIQFESSFNGDIKYHKKRWSVGVGIQYLKFYNNQQAQFSVDASYDTLVTDTIGSYYKLVPSSNSSSAVYDTVYSYYYGSVPSTVEAYAADNSSSRSTFTYIEFPFDISYELDNLNRFKLVLSSGFISSYLRKSDGFVLDSAGTEIVVAESSVSEFLFSVHGGLSVTYAFTKSFTWGVHSRFRKGITSIFNEDHYPIKKTNFLTLGVGIRYLFNK
ncbi:MAG: STN domain-containing protein [Flavobacteriales bacterium]|nr:STN domain-containing protein [Flavobacteriales bacterium]